MEASRFAWLTLGTPPDPLPHGRVNREPRPAAFPQVDEAAMIADLPVAEEPGQQRKGVLSDDLIHERLLPL